MSTWWSVGGTSAGAPQWAALIAIANQGRALQGLGSLDGRGQTLPALYQMPSENFNDIVTGFNGGHARPGFDLVTGHGSPRALVETMRALDKLDFDAMIPGHGRVRRGAEAREHLLKVAELFESIVTQSEAAARVGLSVDDAKKKVDVAALRPHFVTDEVAGRYWDFFVGEAVARAHAEATAK